MEETKDLSAAVKGIAGDGAGAELLEDLRQGATYQDLKNAGEAMNLILNVVGYVAKAAGLSQDEGFIELHGAAQEKVDKARRSLRVPRR